MLKLFLMICFAFLLQSCNSTVPKPETQSSFSPCPTDQHSYKHNCFGSFTYMGSSKYIGEWKDNKRHGNGEYYSGELSNAYNRKFTFKGEWQNDKKHGNGTFFSGIGKFTGNWDKDILTGNLVWTDRYGKKSTVSGSYVEEFLIH